MSDNSASSVTGLRRCLCATFRIFNCGGCCESGTLGNGFRRCLHATCRAFSCSVQNESADSDVQFPVTESPERHSTKVWNLPKYLISPCGDKQGYEKISNSAELDWSKTGQ